MKILFFLCALAACGAVSAQDYNIYFADNGDAVLMDANRVDDVETSAATIDQARLLASVGNALRGFTQSIKTDERALLRAASPIGLHFTFLGETASIYLDRDLQYFAWRVEFSNRECNTQANRYITAVDAVRFWMVATFSGGL